MGKRIMTDKGIEIQGRKINRENSPFIIAEISANHNGSIERAKETIYAAKEAGADAIKIQTYTPDTMTIDSDKKDFKIVNGLWKNRTLHDLYKEAHTPFVWHHELFEYAKSINATIFSSPFDETAVDLLEELSTPAYKIASFEIIDLPLLSYIAKKNKPILISTGMAKHQEVQSAIDTIYAEQNFDVALFHCISSYPTPIELANLKSINYLQEQFNVQVGLSDHTIGNTASIAAISLGATFIEKHFTLSRLDGGPDSSFSLEPKELAELVKMSKQVSLALGVKNFKRPEVEKENKKFRRSIYFIEDIEAGEIITEKKIKRIRPGYGLDPKYYSLLLGKRALKSAKRGDRVTLKHVEIKE